jgi:UDP-N-acetylmuramate--alanine ligase
MYGAARILLRSQARLSGSDMKEFAGAGLLVEGGAKLHVGHASGHVDATVELVIRSAAVPDDNPEVTAARSLGIPVIRYAELLGAITCTRRGVAIAGTHGKSTTTALTTFILRQAKKDPTFVVGAQVKQLGGGSGVGDGPNFVAEACEFDRSFLNLSPKLAAILNIEEDHLDYYRDIADITDAFRSFAARVPADGKLIANGDDPEVVAAVDGLAVDIERFGRLPDSDWRAQNIRASSGCYRFDVSYRGSPFLEASLDHLPGAHQIGNALAATALAHHAGIEPESIADGLRDFRGADRRMTLRADAGGVLVFDDYGHHPTEIRATLLALREARPGRRLWVIFQPHQHSRTRFLLDDFASSFELADRLLVPDIYFVRDSEAEQQTVSSSHLVDRVRAHGTDAAYVPDHDQLIEHVMARVQPGDIVLTLGAGDVWKIADALVRRLS